ncbi:MAG TPA: SGNH/GDSL hydrolase family protein [Cyclobacteriaceae bacterium]|nr:SGNH/GDSL hydrolase family protein [Cyclobacteriaceae bacterium]
MPLLIISLIIAGCSLKPVSVQPDHKWIEYTGRIDFTDPGSPAFSYSGVSIRAAFRGSSVSIRLDDEGKENYYNIILDGDVILRLKPEKGLKTYELAKDLPDSADEIEIFKLTEEMFGKTKFRGFAITGELIPLENKRDHLIEYIGNSITCGYGNEGKNGQAKFSASTENHYLTYAAVTSRNFNARHLAVCKSGIGIYRNYDGPPEGNEDCMPNYYNRIFLYDEQPKYDFKDKPDLVCINLGTNDFSTDGGDSALYVSHYITFIDSVQQYNGGADIICLLGPMLSGEDLAKVRHYVQQVVAVANEKKTGKVHFFEMSQQTGDLGIGIDYHPTVEQHLKNATELTNFIVQLKGWDIVEVNE